MEEMECYKGYSTVFVQADNSTYSNLSISNDTGAAPSANITKGGLVAGSMWRINDSGNITYKTVDVSGYLKYEDNDLSKKIKKNKKWIKACFISIRHWL